LQFITQYPFFILFYSIFTNPHFIKLLIFLLRNHILQRKRRKKIPKKVYIFIGVQNSKTLPPIKNIVVGNLHNTQMGAIYLRFLLSNFKELVMNLESREHGCDGIYITPKTCKIKKSNNFTIWQFITRQMFFNMFA
jgi:hypothetical protein